MYDKNGRAVETRAQTGNATNPIQVQTAVYSKSDKPLSVIDAEGNITSFAYDLADRLTQATDAESRVTQLTYYNDNKPLETKQVISGTPVTVKTQTYTTNGQLLTVKDANNNTTTYGYDSFDRLLTTTYPNTKVESVVYDAASNVTQRTTRDNKVFVFGYDELNRQKLKTPPTPALPIATTYDKTSLVLNVTVGAASPFIHAYDTAGRLSQVTRPDLKVINTQYDAAGNRTQLKYPGTPTYTVDTTYDELGRPKTLKEKPPPR